MGYTQTSSLLRIISPVRALNKPKRPKYCQPRNRMDIRKKEMKECVELVLFYVEKIVVYIHLQQTPIVNGKTYFPLTWEHRHALSLFATAPRARVRSNHSSPIDPVRHQHQ